MPTYQASDFATAPASAIEANIRQHGVKDERIITHVLQVNPGDFRPWESLPLPGAVAILAEALQPDPHSLVLEIGTGTGYLTAVLAVLSRHVVSVELSPRVARITDRSFHAVPYRHKVSIVQGDGRLGYPAHAPYDRICVGGSWPEVPACLLDQLAVGGRLVMPVGPAKRQELQVITRLGHAAEYQTHRLGDVAFPPLIDPAARGK